jgi:hypothetical protein
VDRVAARAVLLGAAAQLIVDRAVIAWTLDNMHPAERATDRHIIDRRLRRADPAMPTMFEHRPAHEEPLLWAVDAVCWATGAGGDWRRRIETILTVVDLEP